MQRRPDSFDPERTRQQRAAAEESRRPLFPADSAPEYPQPPRGQEPASSAQPQTPQKLWPDDRDVNPPWEIDSTRLPAVTPPTEAEQPSDSFNWEYDAAISQSYPSVNFNDMSGTGRIPAIVQLAPGASWSKGIRAPRAGQAVERAGVGVDDQPSAQIRALRAGNLVRATAIVTAALLVSRVLGLFRTSLFAYAFGATYQADAFTNAFTLPDTIFSIVAGGALASAFIPVFTSYLIEKRDREAAWHIASAALNLSMLALTALAALAFVFAEPFLQLTLHSYFVVNCPGPKCEGPMIVSLTRIMLLQPIFLGGATVTIAILQARQHFVLPAIGQVIYTVSLIGGIAATLLDQKTHIFGGNLGINGPAWGVVAGGVLQFAIQVPGLAQARMQYTPTFDIFHPGVRQMFRLMLPRIFNAALLFISIYVNRDLLGLLGTEGAIYGYVTAFTLVMLPIGVFGMAVSQAAFPTFAALAAAGEWQRLRDIILRMVKGVAWLAVPSALGLIVLADPITRLFLAHGSFDPATVPLISRPLIFFSIGLLGLSLVEILTRSFYALHDSRTAVEVSVLQFLFVIALSIILLQPMGAGGLALATSLGSMGEAFVLLLLLRPKLGGLDIKGLGAFMLNVFAASVVAALAALFVYRLGVVLLPYRSTSVSETVREIVRVGAAVVAAGVAYFGFSRFLGTDDVVALDRIFKRFVRR